MKKINSLRILLLLLCTSTFAQVTDVENIEDMIWPENNVYYKDINNVFNTFEGTYLYTNGTTSFKIILEKMIHSSANNVFYHDLIIGAYRYVEDGVEKVNVLNDLDNDYEDGRDYVISGDIVMTGNTLGQDDALSDEKWMYVSIKDPISGNVSALFIRKIIFSGQEAIKISIQYPHGTRHTDAPEPPPISYPRGEFILIKQ